MKQQVVFAFKFLALTGAYFFTRSRTPKHKLSNPDTSMLVLFALEYVKRIWVYNVKLIREAKNQVEILENDVRLFKAFLKDAERMQREDGPLKEFVKEIHGVVREGDEIIVGYLNHEAEIRARNFFQRAFGGHMKLIGVAKEVKAMRAKVKSIYGKSKVVFASATR